MRTDHGFRSGAFAIGLLLASCSDTTKPADEKSGPLDVVLTTPNTADGIMLFRVAGAIDSVTRLNYRTVSVKANETTHAVIVSGNLVNGPVVRIWVRDVLKPLQYSATITEVAAKTTYALRERTGYHLKVQADP